ncbi:MAG: cytochrome P450 [Actinobacteria bacterium]|nr:cytochrome P450 [Actinomycetota bacterium]
MYAALRERDPVHHVADGDHWVLSRFDDVFRAARDPQRFSSAEGLTTMYGEREAVGLDEVAPMVMLDPPDHTEFRRLVSRGFTPRAVITMEDEVRRFVADRLDAIAAADDEVDIVAELFKPLPSMVVAHFLGVPEADRARFDRWTDAVVAANAEGDVLHAAEAVGELFEYFSHLVELRRAEPGDDTVSDLVAAAEADGNPTVLRILGFAFTMVAGGNDTTTGLLGGSAVLLTRHRDQRALLASSPELLPAAVEELLRLTSPVQGLARTTTTDVEVQGTTIPAGRKVLLLYGAANRDPREFGPDAEDLDVTRNPNRILSFGSGAHHCLGAAAARLQGRVALEELLRRFPDFEVDEASGEYAGGPYVRRHRSLPFTPRA